jgi:hypothetical protein
MLRKDMQFVLEILALCCLAVAIFNLIALFLK